MQNEIHCLCIIFVTNLVDSAQDEVDEDAEDNTGPNVDAGK